MTEEIKEILYKFDKVLENYELDKKTKSFSVDSICHLFPNEMITIKNYITNLQKENQSLKEKLNCKEYFSSTMPENTEFVILTKENYDKQQKDLALENIILKSRNEKAIEYIKNTTLYGLRCGKTLLTNYLNDLLNILKGGDE